MGFFNQKACPDKYRQCFNKGLLPLAQISKGTQICIPLYVYKSVSIVVWIKYYLICVQDLVFESCCLTSKVIEQSYQILIQIRDLEFCDN